MSPKTLWQAFAVALLAISVFALAYFPDDVDRIVLRIATPTPEPIVRHCILRPGKLDEITDRFYQDIHFLDDNDVNIISGYTERPVGERFTAHQKKNMQVYTTVFQALKPGTGKYLKGEYHIYFENDVACQIQYTEVDW